MKIIKGKHKHIFPKCKRQMESPKEDQEVTVEVVPQTVTEIIYLSGSDLLNCEPNYYIPSEEELEHEEESELYEIGSVNTADLQHTPLILDESRSFVLLNACFNVGDEEVRQKCSDTNSDQESHKRLNEQEVDSGQEWQPKLSKYKCKVCKVVCHSKKNLNNHALIHANSKQLEQIQGDFVCKMCSCYFDTVDLVSQHMKTCHKPKKPVYYEPPKFKCNICGCPCIHEGALMVHYKKHEPKQFSCDSCSSGYDNAIDLDNHKKTHSTNLLYACNKCNAEFASTSAVSAHLRNVHARPRSMQNSRNSNVNLLPSISSSEDELNVQCNQSDIGEKPKIKVLPRNPKKKKRKCVIAVENNL